MDGWMDAEDGWMDDDDDDDDAEDGWMDCHHPPSIPSTHPSNSSYLISHSTTGNDDPLVLVAVGQLFARGGRAVKARRRYKSSSSYSSFFIILLLFHHHRMYSFIIV
jgi:hypothetical protein